MWRSIGLLRETAWLVGLVVLLVAAAVFAFFELPGLVVSPDDLKAEVPIPQGATRGPAPTAVDLIQARNGARTAAVALIAGVGAALASGFAGRSYYLSRRTQLVDRYAKAVEQLGEQEEAVRVSAIAELERIAYEVPARHRQVMQVLAAFIRTQERAEDSDEVPAAMQSACTALAQRQVRYDGALVLDLAGADLRQVVLEKAKLRGAILRDAKLRGAFLRHSDLRDTKLTNARAQSVRLDGAKLNRAVLDGVRLEGASLDQATARYASFKDAALEGTFLRGTDLRGSAGLHVKEGAIVGGEVSAATKLPHSGGVLWKLRSR